MSDDKLCVETGIVLENRVVAHEVRKLGVPSVFTCPECHGSMVSIQEGSVRRYRCHTGHGFTQGALRQEGLAQIERTLWAALAQIEEQKFLQLELAEQAATAGKARVEAQCRASAARLDGLAARTRALALEPFTDESLS